MARTPMVSRTFITTKVNALCIELDTAEPFNKTVVLPGQYNDSKKLDRALAKLINTDTTKFVHAVDTEEIETLYGMTEQDFINSAMKLDKETRKPIED